FGQSAEGEDHQVGGEGGGRVVHGVVVEDLVVDLVGEHHQPVPAGQVEDALDDLLRIDGAGRVVGVDDDDGPGTVGDLRGHVVEVRVPVGLLVAQVVHGLAAREVGDGGPQGEVRCGDEDFVAVLQQGLHRHGDQ